MRTEKGEGEQKSTVKDPFWLTKTLLVEAKIQKLTILKENLEEILRDSQ